VVPDSCTYVITHFLTQLSHFDDLEWHVEKTIHIL
jgi:hypothetical protein